MPDEDILEDLTLSSSADEVLAVADRVLGWFKMNELDAATNDIVSMTEIIMLHDHAKSAQNDE